VIPPEFEYTAPASLDDALKALADGGEDAKVLAGGHSLLPLMKLRLGRRHCSSTSARSRACAVCSGRTARGASGR